MPGSTAVLVGVGGNSPDPAPPPPHFEHWLVDSPDKPIRPDYVIPNSPLRDGQDVHKEVSVITAEILQPIGYYGCPDVSPPPHSHTLHGIFAGFLSTFLTTIYDGSVLGRTDTNTQCFVTNSHTAVWSKDPLYRDSAACYLNGSIVFIWQSQWGWQKHVQCCRLTVFAYCKDTDLD